ncbi:MAG TPA: AbgT family transporter [Tenuifilaceae bacterium]|nr:AbgT family transporter [Tenuifilaceae bacterium]HPE19275.1 AbgT family transporter [Tenuifilaceae bacterium]HPJ47132.1 AbgT family transporter [Tenuifilaceae bacterium]HPQ35004.1 AbgT family transporter [Tenuifilaceae bacterium]HRX68555.1 AbgT family transporter [Tenuifilaceae bacterium]
MVKEKKKREFPHTYVIIFSLIIISALLTWIVPGGEFEREINTLKDGTQREVIVKDSFHYTDNNPQTWQIFSSFFEGFVDKADIIVFILMIGGAFWIMNDSKAIDVGIFYFLKKTKRIEHIKFIKFLGIDNIIISLIMIMFSVFGAVFGMSEETIAFVIIFVPLALSMGYDSIVGVNMCFVAAGLGFAGALLNPFTIGIAQGLSGIPLFTGIEYRLFAWLVLNVVGIIYVLRYAKKVKKNPESSPVFEEDNVNWRTKEHIDPEHMKYYTPKAAWVVYGVISVILVVVSVFNFKTTLSVGNSITIIPIIPILAGLFVVVGPFLLRKSVHFFIINILLYTILFLIVGVMGYGWYVMEIATLFFAMGIFSGIANNKSPNRITKLFLEGAKDIASAALIVGLAGGIIIVLQEGKIIDTILYSVSQSMQSMGKVGSIGVMYLIQTFINIIIPSGSAKAALTMPIMAPFSDLIGISRQATVVAFQFGDGFTNMITPTSGVLIGVLGVAKIPYDKWVKWITPFMIILIILGFLLLIPTVTMQLNGF